MKQTKAAILPFSKLPTFFNLTISIHTKDPLNPASEGNRHFYVFVDLFSKYVVAVPTSRYIVHYDVDEIIHH